jgi:hypothetical protein
MESDIIAKIMENYRIYFEEGEEEEILNVLRRFHDVIVDNISSNSIGITIERDDANSFYIKLLDDVDREIYAFRPHHRYY